VSAIVASPLLGERPGRGFTQDPGFSSGPQECAPAELGQMLGSGGALSNPMAKMARSTAALARAGPLPTRCARDPSAAP
jgi:hypothetical protein